MSREQGAGERVRERGREREREGGEGSGGDKERGAGGGGESEGEGGREGGSREEVDASYVARLSRLLGIPEGVLKAGIRRSAISTALSFSNCVQHMTKFCKILDPL